MTIYIYCENFGLEASESLSADSTNLHYTNDLYDRYSKNYVDLEVVCRNFKGIENYIVEHYYPPKALCDYFLTDIVEFVDPIFNEDFTLVEYFESEDKKKKGIRSKSKPIKLLRKMCPGYTDSMLEKILGEIKVNTLLSKNLKFESGNTEDYFEDVYTERPHKYIENLGKYSCINASCMRHTHYEVHPVRAYASGDFTLHVARNTEGKLLARAIVCDVTKTYSAIYTVSKTVGEKFEDYLQELGYKDEFEENTGWAGAKLKVIKLSQGLIAAPYVDIDTPFEVSGNYIYAGSGRTYLDETCGYIKAKCYCCGRTSYDYIEKDREFYCEDCWFFCEYFEEIVVDEYSYRVEFEFGYETYSSSAIEEASDLGLIVQDKWGSWICAEYYNKLNKTEEEEIEP